MVRKVGQNQDNWQQSSRRLTNILITPGFWHQNNQIKADGAGGIVGRKLDRQGFVEPARRAPQLVAERNRKMAASAHAYVRGSTVRFYQWLEDSNRAALPEGPDAWICGDCHVGNLGPLGGADGELAVQIRDLDQTVIGNPVHDLIRLALSLATAARGSDLPGVTTAHIIERMVNGYEQAFAPEADDQTHDPTAEMPKIVRKLMRDAAGRSWRHLADERIEGTEPEIPLGKRFWPLTKEERSAIATLFEQENTRRLVTALRSRNDDAQLRVMDAAYWRKGCSSLGGLRFAVLLAVDVGDQERHCLVDVKEAVPAAAPHSQTGQMPADNAQRVVAGARHLSPFLGDRMLAERLLDKPVFIRELLPQDLKLEIERLSRQEAMEMAEFLARVVGRAHARQLPEADRKIWLSELQKNRSKSLDAPNWLWTSVVDLVSVHEAAYLNHCRRHALEDAAQSV
jgi:uncharacterized protein (DUF2252 family)